MRRFAQAAALAAALLHTPGLAAQPVTLINVFEVPAGCKRGDEARLPARVVNVLGRLGARGFGLTLWIAMTTTRRAADIAGSRF